MTTKTPAKKAAKPAVKKAAQAPARPRTRPALAAPPPVADPPVADPPADPPATGDVTITFHGRTFPVITPSQEQMALLLDIVDWSRKLATLQATLSAMPEDTPPDHPEVVRGQQAIEQALRRIGRMNTIVKTLVPEIEWEIMQDGMAERTLPWQDFANLPYLILAAHNEAGLMKEANRAARRQQGRRAV